MEIYFNDDNFDDFKYLNKILFFPQQNEEIERITDKLIEEFNKSEKIKTILKKQKIEETLWKKISEQLTKKEDDILIFLYDFLYRLDIFTLCSLVRSSLILRYFIGANGRGWKEVAEKYINELYENPLLTEYDSLDIKWPDKNFEHNKREDSDSSEDNDSHEDNDKFDPDLVRKWDLPLRNFEKTLQFNKYIQEEKGAKFLLSLQEFSNKIPDFPINYFWVIIAIAMRNEQNINFFVGEPNGNSTKYTPFVQLTIQKPIRNFSKFFINLRYKNMIHDKLFYTMIHYFRLLNPFMGIRDKEDYYVLSNPGITQTIGIIYAILCVDNVYIELKHTILGGPEEDDVIKKLNIREKICDTCDEQVAKLTCNICKNVNYCQSCGEQEIKKHIC